MADDHPSPKNGQSITLPIVLIGPVNAGKSTIATLLAERLGLGRASLDDLCWEYFEGPDCSYDPDVAREHFKRGGQMGALEYMVQFYPGAIAWVLAVHPESIIDLGAGHTVYDDPELLERAQRVLAPLPNVVLLLPSPDPDESLRILSARDSNPHSEIIRMNEQFVRHPSNGLLATIVAYTKDRTPEQTCEEISGQLK